MRARDNLTNWLYIGRAWLVIAAAIAAAIACHQHQQRAGLSPWWNLPVALAAIAIIGACQHQLANAGHEAVHYMLFRHRLLNELASDWLCMFPLYITTQQFRVHHLAHHQYVNDDDKDPVRVQLRKSGQWHDFPITGYQFLGILVRALLLWNTARYTLTRAKFNALSGRIDGPEPGDARPRRVLDPVLMAHAVILPPVLWLLLWRGWPVAAGATLAAAGAATLGLIALAPDAWFTRGRVRPIIRPRITAAARIAFVTLLYAMLALLAWRTGQPVFGYFIALWVAPLFTSFAGLMILRELIQHGNNDRGRWTNSRVFRVNPLLRFAVFPFGNEYHLPHHLYPGVPHYRLRGLHEALMADPGYAGEPVEVDGVFRGRRGRPSVVQALGPGFAPASKDVFIDDSVIDNHDD